MTAPATDAAAGTFQVELQIGYTRLGIPPRCRNPRPIPHSTVATVAVDSVTDEQAPVAFRWNDSPHSPTSRIRLYRGRLYQPLGNGRPWGDPVKAGSSGFPAQRAVEFGQYDDVADEGQAIRAATDQMDGHLIVDGGVWVRCGEPRYGIAVFGFNSMSLTIDTVDDTRVPADRFFRADEYDTAIAAMQAMADTGLWQMPGHEQTRIDVVIPDAVTLVTCLPETGPQSKARLDFWKCVDHLHHGERDRDADQEQLYADLAAAHARVRDLGISIRPLELTRPFEQRTTEQG